jgi:Predicted nucleic acid-binding protein, contains PIN domain
VATIVLDAHALMVLFNDESGAEEVEKILLKAESGNPRLLMSVINWGEIYYSIMRGASQEIADAKAHEIAGMRIELVPVDVGDLELIRQAAAFKATKKMSYADCFAAALAKLRNAKLLTGDRDFKAVESDLKVGWLR